VQNGWSSLEITLVLEVPSKFDWMVGVVWTKQLPYHSLLELKLSLAAEIWYGHPVSKKKMLDLD
jgi:hypothetical protein